ncbi:MAG: hypothetical protein Q8P42_01320 [Gallionella sp.]|nr:hypothetical protein [Gallionella sp.]
MHARKWPLQNVALHAACKTQSGSTYNAGGTQGGAAVAKDVIVPMLEAAW